MVVSCVQEGHNKEMEGSGLVQSEQVRSLRELLNATENLVYRVIEHNAWIVTVDLKDTHWHVPIHQRFQPFLGFRVNNQSYVFKAMLFGLNIAPRIFTMLCSVIGKELRQKGMKTFAYMDDRVVWAASEILSSTYRNPC